MSAASANALTQLWNVDAICDVGDSPSSGRPFLVLPSADQPRLVLPTRPHRAAAAILNALRDKSTFSARARTFAARAALTAGARAVRLPDPDLLAVVINQLPDGEYCYGVHLGPPRANRKPVLVLATERGELVAFVKWGIDALTDRLVRNEATALPAVADLASVHVPRLLGTGEHRSHPFVIQSPVPAGGPARAEASTVVAAQIEVASVGRGSIDVPATLDAIAAEWARRAANSSLAESGVTQFAELATHWAEQASDASLTWGSWHGDWRRTNMTVTSSGCSVWDWERFATGVPAGYDALHLFLMTHAVSVHDLRSLPADLFDNAERLLRPFDVHGRGAAELVTTGYLLELAGRYLDDNQSQAGARLGSVQQWLLPFLSAKLGPGIKGPVRREVSES